MNRKATTFLAVLLLLLAACGGQKPKPPVGNGWRQGRVALTAAPELDLGTCMGISSIRTQEWGASSGLPDRPEDTLIMIAAGHGPNGKRPPYTTCYNTDGSESPLPTVAGKSDIQEDELTMALTLRLEAVLKRLGFPVELIRYGDYGTEGDCAQKALFRKSPLVRSANNNALFCGWRYLSVRGRSDVYKLSSIKRLCANEPACINDVLIAGTKHAISRAGQIVRDHAARLKIAYDPAGENNVNSPKVSYLSIHFNSVRNAAGDGVGTMLAMFSGTVRHQKSSYRSNPALTFQGPNHAPLGSVAKNYATSVFEYMFHSLRKSGTLPEARDKHALVYLSVDLVNSKHRAQPATPYSFKSDSREGPLNDPNKPIWFNVNPPNTGATGPVTVVSGLESYKVDYAANKDIISIPNNVTLEVAHYRDCRNAEPLLRSLQRPVTDHNFDAGTSPLNNKDPLDVAAMDIAHGLVEYYESYVPGFKQKACDNLKNSDWKDHLPDWCPGGGGGGGGGNAVPDIDNVVLDPTSVEIPVGQSASAALTFSNAGNADLTYSVTADIPQVSITGASSGTVAPRASVSVGVSYSCKPDEPGRFEGAISISSNDPDEPAVLRNVSVNCIAPQIKVKELPVPYVTAFNFIDDPNDDSSYANVYDIFDFYEISGKVELEYTLELPEWLNMPATGVLPPGGAYSDVFAEYWNGMKTYTYGPEALCNGAQEREDIIVIHSNDPVRPRIEVPVRLMCPEMEVTVSPDVYNEPGTPIERRCTPVSGKIVIKGAEHFQEMHTRVEDANGSSTVSYIPPLITYRLRLRAMETRLRWPYFHASTSIYEPWSWSQFPELPFVTWIGTCSMHPGSQTIDYVTLRNPATVERSDLQYLANLLVSSEAYTFTVEDSNLPGIVYNGSGKKAKLKFHAMFGITPEQTIVLPPAGIARVWHWLRFHKFQTWLWDDDENKWVEGELDLGGHNIISFDEQMKCRYLPINYILNGSGTPVLDVNGKGYLWALYIGAGGGANFTAPSMECYSHFNDLPPWWNGREPERKPPSVRQ